MSWLHDAECKAAVLWLTLVADRLARLLCLRHSVRDGLSDSLACYGRAPDIYK